MRCVYPISIHISQKVINTAEFVSNSIRFLCATQNVYLSNIYRIHTRITKQKQQQTQEKFSIYFRINKISFTLY